MLIFIITIITEFVLYNQCRKLFVTNLKKYFLQFWKSIFNQKLHPKLPTPSHLTMKTYRLLLTPNPSNTTITSAKTLNNKESPSDYHGWAQIITRKWLIPPPIFKIPPPINHWFAGEETDPKPLIKNDWSSDSRIKSPRHPSTPGPPAETS